MQNVMLIRTTAALLASSPPGETRTWRTAKNDTPYSSPILTPPAPSFNSISVCRQSNNRQAIVYLRTEYLICQTTAVTTPRLTI